MPEAVHGRLTRSLGKNYEVWNVVGRGGFAAVYEIWDHNLERRLAAKVMHLDVASSPGTIERFRHEAKTVARLNHPNILPIHFVGDAEDLAFYVMPFVEGESLKEVIGRGKMPMDAALKIAQPVLEALAHAHSDDLVHRDIKPDNVMIEGSTGRALLVDFGIAKALDPKRASNMTQAGFAVGTPHYMSPEQTLGDSIDGRSDLYSFGVMLYEMVTGRKPFDGETSQEIVGMHIADDPPNPADVDADVEPWISGVILKALAKKPSDRYQTAQEMLDALESREANRASESVEDILGGVIVQGSGLDDDEMFRYTPPASNPEPMVPVEPAGDIIPDIAPEVEPEPPAVVLETLAEVNAAGDKESAPEVEAVAEDSSPEAQPVGITGTMAGDRPQRIQTDDPETASSGSLKLLGTLIVLALAFVGGGAAALNGVGPSGLQAFYRKIWNPIAARTAGVIGNSANQIVVTNSLLDDVEFLVDGEVEMNISASGTGSLPLTGNIGSSLSWRLVRSISSGGQVMGGEFSGELSAGAESAGSRQYVVSATVGEARLFSPIIDNFSSRDVVVLVSGADGDVRCNCVVPAGQRAARIGYYPLSVNTVLRVYDVSTPYGGRYDEIEVPVREVDALSGAVEITLRD